MEPGQNRLAPIRRADLDGIMLLAAINRPEYMDPSGGGKARWHACTRDPLEAGSRLGRLFDHLGINTCQPGCLCKLLDFCGIGKCRHQHRRQKPRLFGQQDAKPVQLCVTLPPRPIGAAQRALEVQGWIGCCLDPSDIRILGHDDPRDIAIISARCQGLGPAIRDSKVDTIGREPPEILQSLGPRGFGRKDQRPAGRRHQSHGGTDAKIGPGTGDLLLDRQL